MKVLIVSGEEVYFLTENYLKESNLEYNQAVEHLMDHLRGERYGIFPCHVNANTLVEWIVTGEDNFISEQVEWTF